MIGHVMKPEEVHEQWWQIEPLLKRAVEAGDGEAELRDILQLVDENKMIIGVLREAPGEEVLVALAAEILAYPRKRILSVSYVGGKPLALTRGKDLYRGLEAVAKISGCSIIQGLCGPAQARYFNRVFGLKPVYTVLRKEVSP